MNDSAVLLGIGAALAIGAMSPGPSFLMVARTAVVASRRDALAAAAGMSVGGALLALTALCGLHVLLTSVPVLHMVLKLAGGAYLLYLGWAIWSGAARPLQAPDDGASRVATPRIGRSFLTGLVTQVSNPKTAIVYASVFTAFLPAHLSFKLGALLTVLVFAIEAGWYGFVALALSSLRPRAVYLRYKRWIDRVAGGVMAALGVKLMLDARAV